MKGRKSKGWKIFAIVVGAIVILASGNSALDKAKDLLGRNDDTTQESVEDTTSTASINNFYEVC